MVGAVPGHLDVAFAAASAAAVTLLVAAAVAAEEVELAVALAAEEAEEAPAAAAPACVAQKIHNHTSQIRLMIWTLYQQDWRRTQPPSCNLCGMHITTCTIHSDCCAEVRTCSSCGGGAGNLVGNSGSGSGSAGSS